MCSRLINLFITQEVLDLKEFRGEFESELSTLPHFQQAAEAQLLWKDIHLRIIEHVRSLLLS